MDLKAKHVDEVHELESDGLLLGAKRLVYPADTAQELIIAIGPDNDTEASATALLVNGMKTDLDLHFDDIQGLANTGLNVIGLHSQFDGTWAENMKALKLKCSWKFVTPCVESIAGQGTRVLLAGEQFRLGGHSMGAISIVRAIHIIEQTLKEHGLADPRVQEALENILVETYGGAATRYPNGPRYLHLCNLLDPIAASWGIGIGPSRMFGLARFGKDADVHIFSKAIKPQKLRPQESTGEFLSGLIDRTFHNPRRIYFEERKKLKEQGRTLF